MQKQESLFFKNPPTLLKWVLVVQLGLFAFYSGWSISDFCTSLKSKKSCPERKRFAGDVRVPAGIR